MKFSLLKNISYSTNSLEPVQNLRQVKIQLLPHLVAILNRFLIIFFFFVAACFVRIYQLSDYSFSNDEAWHLVVANQKNLWEVIKYNFSYEVHPPLSPIIWHLMLKISDNDLWLRSASLLSSILIIPSAYIFGRLWIGKIAGISMSFICAFGAMPISLSSAIRAYSMLALTLLWIGIFAFRYLNDDKRKNLFFYFFCCLAAIELHHSAAFIVLTFGLLLSFKAFCNKNWNNFFFISLIHILLALAVIGYSYVLSEYFEFKGNNGYFSSAQTFVLSLLNYLINFFALFSRFLPLQNNSIGQTAVIALIIFLATPALFIFSRKWNLLAITYVPFIAISLSDYFGYYPFSPVPRNNLFLILPILIGYGYFAQITYDYFINFLNYEKKLSSFKLENLIKEKDFSLGIIIFRPCRIAFSYLVLEKKFLPIVNFTKILASLSVISLVTFYIFSQDFFRKTWPGCEEFLIKKSDRNLLIEELEKRVSQNELLVTINTDIWKFQIENKGTIEVITPNLAKFKNNEFLIYFSSFPEREKGSNSSLAEYEIFFTDLFEHLKSNGEFDKIKSISFFDSGLNNDYLSIISHPDFPEEIKNNLKRKSLSQNDYKLLKETYDLTNLMKDSKYLLKKLYFKDSSFACGRKVFVISFPIKFIDDHFLYQKTNLLSDSTKNFGDKIDEKTKLYSHTIEAFSPILAQKVKLNRKEENSSRDLFFGINNHR